MDRINKQFELTARVRSGMTVFSIRRSIRIDTTLAGRDFSAYDLVWSKCHYSGRPKKRRGDFEFFPKVARRTLPGALVQGPGLQSIFAQF
jgi:hypothetical protein